MRQTIRFCETSDGVRIAYAVAGNGPPLVRVGGWLTHVERDWGSPVWSHWLRAFATNHTLARFDLRGSGLSDRDVGDMDLDAWVRDLEAVADDLGWERFPLFGLCQGGVMAMAYAVRHPERVSHLVLYNSYLYGGFSSAADERMAKQTEALRRMIEVGWGRSTRAFRDVFARLLMPEGDEEQLSWWDDLQRITAPPENAVRLWTAFNEVDIRDRVPRIRVPTLVCHVRGDCMVPFEQGRELAALIPGASFLPLEGDNHVLQADDDDWSFGIHRAVGGYHDAPNPGDILSAALAACLYSTTRMVADRVGIPLPALEVSASAEVDVRGTLMVDRTVPVAFQRMRCVVRGEVPSGVSAEQLKLLSQTAEHCCVVLQTLTPGVEVETRSELNQDLRETVANTDERTT